MYEHQALKESLRVIGMFHFLCDIYKKKNYSILI